MHSFPPGREGELYPCGTVSNHISNVPPRPIWLIPTQAIDPTSNSQDLKDQKAASLGFLFQDE